MLLVDTNVFVYARREHEYTDDCMQLIRRAPEQTDWFVPALVLLELTHYFQDNGAYADRIGGVFLVTELSSEDLFWAAANSDAHAEFNDHAILHTAHRIGCNAVVSYDSFFGRQAHFPEVDGVRPIDVD